MTSVIYDLQARTFQDTMHLLSTAQGNCLVFPAPDDQNRYIHLTQAMYLITERVKELCRRRIASDASVVPLMLTIPTNKLGHSFAPFQVNEPPLGHVHHVYHVNDFV